MKQRPILWLVLIGTLLCVSSARAQSVSGKLTGKVIDAETKEPLIRASVRIEGTKIGAVTDLEGNYIILNVPVGVYRVRASYIGYTDVTVEGVKITSNLTTRLDFSLGTKAKETAVIDVIADRPLVEPSATTKTMIISNEQIMNSPVRGVQGFVGLQAGVIQPEGSSTIYMRGGRAGEVAFYVDGILQNNPLNNGFAGNVSNDALQEIVVQSSFDAEFGNAASGIVTSTTRDPSTDKYTGNVHLITDAFLPKRAYGTNQFGGYGYNLGNISVGGPLIPGFRDLSFYGLIEYQNLEDRDPRQGFGVLPGNDLQQWNGVYKLRYELGNGIDLKLGGNFTRTASRSANDGSNQLDTRAAITENSDFVRDEQGNIIDYSFVDRDGIAGTNTAHMERTETAVDQVYLRYTQALTAKSYFTIQGQFLRQFTERMDNTFRRDFHSYKAQLDSVPSAFDAFGLFINTGRPLRRYQRELIQYFEVRGDFETQVSEHNIKAGGQFRYHTYKFGQFDPSIDPRANVNNINFIGYTPEDFGFEPLTTWYNSYTTVTRRFDPNTGMPLVVDTTLVRNSEIFDPRVDRARNPIIASAYIKDRYGIKDFNVNIGLRFDYLNANTLAIDLKNPLKPDGSINFGDNRTIFVLQPRISFSFPVSEQTVFHAQYGRFAQMPQLQFLYDSRNTSAQRLRGQGIGRNPNLQAEITDSYEIGFQQMLGDATSIDVTAFYKETSNLLQTIRIQLESGLVLNYYGNADFGTIRGLDVTLRSNRFNNLNLSAAYTLQFAGGTNTDPTRFAEFYRRNSDAETAPTAIAALDFDQRHTGNIQVDYRVGLNDKSMPEVLRGFGANLLIRFNSGNAYTPVFANFDPVTQSGVSVARAFKNTAYTPWIFRVDLRLDKSFKLFDKLNSTVYLWALNLLGNDNVVSVFPTTGQPDNGGWSETAEFKQNFESTILGRLEQSARTPERDAEIEKKYREHYKARERNPFRWGTAQQVRLGLMLGF
jgi:outer membrane receptor protein involved in Fe transport